MKSRTSDTLTVFLAATTGEEAAGGPALPRPPPPLASSSIAGRANPRALDNPRGDDKEEGRRVVVVSWTGDGWRLTGASGHVALVMEAAAAGRGRGSNLRRRGRPEGESGGGGIDPRMMRDPLERRMRIRLGEARKEGGDRWAGREEFSNEFETRALQVAAGWLKPRFAPANRGWARCQCPIAGHGKGIFVPARRALHVLLLAVASIGQ